MIIKLGAGKSKQKLNKRFRDPSEFMTVFKVTLWGLIVVFHLVIRKHEQPLPHNFLHGSWTHVPRRWKWILSVFGGINNRRELYLKQEHHGSMTFTLKKLSEWKKVMRANVGQQHSDHDAGPRKPISSKPNLCRLRSSSSMNYSSVIDVLLPVLSLSRKSCVQPSALLNIRRHHCTNFLGAINRRQNTKYQKPAIKNKRIYPLLTCYLF